ncbi:MAG: Phosphatidylglycerol--prolipoprotein diacylglyceryl transferase [Burkholderia sp.]|jgi:phosphatidylglycerol---prolipoprotein diacylglyceryl transferase
MLIHPQFDPVAFSIGPISVRWYGLMYLAGFALFWLLGRRRAAEPWRGITAEHVENMLFWGVIGVIVGARLGYCLFYQPAYYMADPVRILEVWHGGMSAHGGMIGVIAVMIGYAAYYKLSFWTVSDFVAPLVPLGLFCGRIGNFINGELWGRPAPESLPWAMVFPQAGDGVPRHPSELYEAGAEGLLLFALLWIVSKKPRPAGFVSGLFLAGYGLARFVCEWFREPDSFLGLQALGLSRGQWLTLPVLLLGIVIMAWSVSRAKKRA